MTESLSPQLLAQQIALWRQHPPFDAMAEAPLERLVTAAEQRYFAPGETLIDPGAGPARELFVVKSGLVSARHGLAELDPSGSGWQYEAGDCFPMAALMNERAVTASYSAETDVFLWVLPAAVVREVADASPPFAAHLTERVLQLLQLAGREQARQAALQAQAALAQQAMEKPLGELMRTQVLAVGPDTPLELALRAMAQRRVGSCLIVDAAQRPLGILTRDDVLDRITLPQRPLHLPVSTVMSTPVRTLTLEHSAQDAALLMSRHALRHVPVLDGERLAGIVSERDLFAHARLSVQRVSGELRDAPDVAGVLEQAPRIRELSRLLAGQGVGPRTLCALIAHLNDLLSERLVQLHAAELGLDLRHAAWLAFGSEGRGEQTPLTDQDNGIVFDSDDPERDRPQWLRLGERVCDSLDRAGFPLCKGGVMARNPDCCRSVGEWKLAFREWLAQGTPEDLLRVSIFFDARAVAGNETLAVPLRELASGQDWQGGAVTPRFLRLMADNALRSRVPLSWRGALDPEERGGEAGLDLKLQGTALFVDAARLMALDRGVDAVGTRERLTRAGERLGVSAAEHEGWAAAFEFLLGLRLRQQLASDAGNWVPIAALNDLDRRTLRVSLRVAQRLQQRLQLDYVRVS